MPLNLLPGDRVMILAPHPDDESLATGGLILRALSIGAEVRVLFGTNGDNNPWPQRWVERRWNIGPDDQKRWGAARQREAQAAVAHLGLPPEAAVFLNFPDQGTSELLWQRSEAAICRISEEIAAFRPTLCVIPSQYDLHRDHNALHLLWQIAEYRAGLERAPRQLHYLVHHRNPRLAPPPIAFQLTVEERTRKYDAILCHQTQMILSKKRFLAYARPEEFYHLPPPVSAEQPEHHVAYAQQEGDHLRLTLNLPKRSIGAALHLCGETADDRGLRWIGALPWFSGEVTPFQSTLPEMNSAVFRRGLRRAKVTIPFPASLRVLRLYAKFQRPTFFLDESGWRSVPLTSRDA